MTVFQSSLYMTTSAIIQTDEAIIMTDPNWLPNEVEEIRNFINNHLGDKQLYIIYTHSDFDHIIGSGAFPEAKVIASRQFNNHPYKDEIVQKIHKFDQRYYLQRNYTPTYPAVDIIVSKDGEKLELGSITLTFYQAPGHTNDGLFTVVEPYGIFLSGDYLSDVEFPFIFSSYQDYIKSMNTAESILLNHELRIHIPGHGTTTDSEQEIKSRLDFSKFYLQHLLEENGELEKYLSENFTFYDGMKSIHDENKKLAIHENEENEE